MFVDSDIRPGAFIRKCNLLFHRTPPPPPAEEPQVLYLIFKGSSFMNDFVANASVGPDYTPFDATFSDRTTFIHHGAHHESWLDVCRLTSNFEDGTSRSLRNKILGHCTAAGSAVVGAAGLRAFLTVKKARPLTFEGAM